MSRQPWNETSSLLHFQFVYMVLWPIGLSFAKKHDIVVDDSRPLFRSCMYIYIYIYICVCVCMSISCGKRCIRTPQSRKMKHDLTTLRNSAWWSTELEWSSIDATFYDHRCVNDIMRGPHSGGAAPGRHGTAALWLADCGCDQQGRPHVRPLHVFFRALYYSLAYRNFRRTPADEYILF